MAKAAKAKGKEITKEKEKEARYLKLEISDRVSSLKEVRMRHPSLMGTVASARNMAIKPSTATARQISMEFLCGLPCLPKEMAEVAKVKEKEEKAEKAQQENCLEATAMARQDWNQNHIRSLVETKNKVTRG